MALEHDTANLNSIEREPISAPGYSLWQLVIYALKAGAGAVGVWTKADSVAAFDDFRYGAAPAK